MFLLLLLERDVLLISTDKLTASSFSRSLYRTRRAAGIVTRIFTMALRARDLAPGTPLSPCRPETADADTPRGFRETGSSISDDMQGGEKAREQV